MSTKEGAPYHAWIELDPATKDRNGNHILKHYHENYGFELGKSLVALPIKELGNDEERMKLIKSLEKGNLQAVTFGQKGKEERMFIEANPKFKTLNVYDGGMKRVKKNVENQEVKTSSKKENEGVNKKDVVKTEQNKVARKTTKKVSDKEQPGLLPKKRVSKKNGLTK